MPWISHSFLTSGSSSVAAMSRLRRATTSGETPLGAMTASHRVASKPARPAAPRGGARGGPYARRRAGRARPRPRGRPQLAGADQLQAGRQDAELQVDAALVEVDHRLGRTLVGNMGELDARHSRELNGGGG